MIAGCESQGRHTPVNKSDVAMYLKSLSLQGKALTFIKPLLVRRRLGLFMPHRFSVFSRIELIVNDDMQEFRCQ